MRKYTKVWIPLLVFVLLFLGGLQVNPLLSAVLSALDTLCLVLYVWLFTGLLGSQKINRASRIVGVVMTFLLLGVCVVLLLQAEGFVQRLLFPDRERPQMIYPLFRVSLLTMGSYIGAMSVRSRRTQMQAEALQQEKQEMEVQLLRNQMNPHFMFNALNTIYSLSYTKDRRAPDMIMKLAEMLRYITDECQADRVPVENEIHYIESYVAFQRIRYGERPNLKFTYTLENPRASIPPMILQPFVENCFKHGEISTNKEAQVLIELSVTRTELYMTTSNRVKEDEASMLLKERDGVGIPNVVRRLDLYYPHAYSLTAETEEGVYKTELCIQYDRNY